MDSMVEIEEAMIMTTLRRIWREDKSAPLHALRRAYYEGYEAAMAVMNRETAKRFAADNPPK